MRTQKYSKIRIIFENCDSITLPEDDIEYFYADNINFDITAQDGYVSVYNTSNNILISIRKSAFDKYTEFKPMLTDEDEIEYHKLKNRINSSDITQIYLLDDEDNELESIFVKWSDDDEFHNKYQTQNIIDEKYLVISIKEE